MENWYNLSSVETMKKLNTDKNGLNSEEVDSRLKQYGENKLEEAKKKSLASKLIDQFKDPMIIILLAASAMSAIIGELADMFIILAIVLINAALSIYQEGKAEAAIEALQKMSAPNARVCRDGHIKDVPSNKVVPGDIVFLETGSIVPADMRLIESVNLKIDESSLTGESVAVEKDAEITFESTREIGDRENIAYSSTIVTYGRGTGVVVETGKNTEIGKIATSLSEVEDEETPLQKRLAGLSKFLGILVLAVCGVVFLVGWLYDGMDLLDVLMTSISLAVAAIPEGLPAIVTIVLSMGMGRMAERNAIVKKLLAVETLGTTTVICSDKTGTLTQNEMTVTKAFVNGKLIEVSGSGYEPEGELTSDGEKVDAYNFSGLKELMGIASLVNDADLNKKDDGTYEMMGDPTEGALLSFTDKSSLNHSDLRSQYERIREIPFDSDRKMMTTFHEDFIENGKKFASLTKGAPDVIIERCSKILLDGKEVEFSESLKQDVLNTNTGFAKQALRTLAYAYNTWDEIPQKLSSEEVENNMVFVGITGMIDPARPEVKNAIAECKKAGILPIMITGDHLDTAFAIGKELGIADSEDQAIMGRELNKMNEEELREIVKEKRIFARVSPENKVQIVTALKQNGEITAMTGDGVNDAPALKRADIGVSMGITGTDVAKNTAEVILTDDNFATIVNAVEEGRIIYANIKKFISFLLSCNIGEVLIVFIATIFAWPVPMTAKQLLWLNLVTDSFPALALGVEPGEKDIMNEKPRDPNEPIIDRSTGFILVVQSIAITIATLVAFYIGLNRFGGHTQAGEEGARTYAFVTLILAELLRSFSSRSDKHSVFKLGLFTNKQLIYAVLASFSLLLIVLYIPVLADMFDVFPLGVRDWSVLLPLAFLPLILGEVYKAVKDRD